MCLVGIYNVAHSTDKEKRGVFKLINTLFSIYEHHVELLLITNLELNHNLQIGPIKVLLSSMCLFLYLKHGSVFVLRRWHRGSDGSLHRSQHPHHPGTVWLSLRGGHSLLLMQFSPFKTRWKPPPIGSVQFLTWRFQTNANACFSRHDTHTLTRRSSSMCSSHSHIPAKSTLNTLTFWMYYILN